MTQNVIDYQLIKSISGTCFLLPEIRYMINPFLSPAECRKDKPPENFF